MNLVESEGVASVSAGVDRGWDMPAALLHAPRGLDTIASTSRPALSHHVLAFSLSGPTGAEAVVGGRHLEQSGPGTMTVLPVGPQHGFRAAAGVRFAHLYFTDGFIRRLGAELYGGAGDRGGLLRDDSVFFRDPDLREVAGNYVTRALDAEDPPTALEMDSRAVLVGLRLFDRHSVLAPPKAATPPRGGLAPWRLRRATEWLEAHMAEDARLADLAAAVGLSERHLCTAFRASTGRPPHRWLLERRVERAKALLAAGPARPVTEVALACGFASSAHFATVFRKIAGQTPSAWRDSVARRDGG